jgi:aspartate kinase
MRSWGRRCGRSNCLSRFGLPVTDPGGRELLKWRLGCYSIHFRSNSAHSTSIASTLQHLQHVQHQHPQHPSTFSTSPALRSNVVPVVVQKYGGSSVADVERIRQVAERVMRTRAQGYDVVVVVSAMGDTTDDLLALARKVSRNPERRELDMLLSAGERISMALLSMAIRELGGDAISFTGSQSGIITNDRHIDARIIEVRPFRVQDELARGRVVVIAGYQGVSYRREVTTLGRGGSDTTAVAMAAALGADWCEICSDVDGVYTADPRVVPAARRIGALSYEETQELAEAGAKVLNAQAVEFAKERGIAIYARATASALPGTDPTSDGTVVRKHAPRMPGTVAGVASERELLVLIATGDATALLECLDARAVAGKQLHIAAFDSPAESGHSTVENTTLVISRENLHDEDRLRAELQARFGDAARLVDDVGAVSVIGAGINASYANVRRGGAALLRAGLQTRGVATSSFRITWLLNRASTEAAVRVLHEEFLEREGAAVGTLRD